MPKPDPKAKAKFEELVAMAPGAVIKPMFGNFSAFKGGAMFAGVFGNAVFVRLGERDRAEALALPGAKTFEVMKGRPMTEYVCLPLAILADKKKAGAWVAKSLAYAGSIPAKKSASKTRAKK